MSGEEKLYAFSSLSSEIKWYSPLVDRVVFVVGVYTAISLSSPETTVALP